MKTRLNKIAAFGVLFAVTLSVIAISNSRVQAQGRRLDATFGTRNGSPKATVTLDGAEVGTFVVTKIEDNKATQVAIFANGKTLTSTDKPGLALGERVRAAVKNKSADAGLIADLYNMITQASRQQTRN